MQYVLYFGDSTTQTCNVTGAAEDWQTFVPDKSSIVKITQQYVDVGGGGSNNGTAGAVDGLLIDGPADNSQTWSQVATVGEPLTKRSLEILFNGTDESPIGFNAPAANDNFYTRLYCC